MPMRASDAPAHPRVGGENQVIQLDADTLAGSSPRGRGKLIDRRDNEHTVGLIPAWAGKTKCLRSSAYNAGAHPRVGGENT